MAVLVSTIITGAQALLNDVGGTLFTTTNLLPFVKKGWNELQLRLVRVGRLPSVKEIASPVTVTALATVYPSLPADIIEPIRLEERTPSSSDNYNPMSQEEFEPNAQKTENLRFWTWREEDIKFLGATADREVRLYYAKSLIAIVDGTTSLPVTMAQTFLEARTAALAAFIIGENSTRSSELNQDAAASLEEVIGIEVSGMQGIIFRHKPYGYRRLRNRRYW